MLLVPAARVSIKALQAGNELQYLFQEKNMMMCLCLGDQRKNPATEKVTEEKQNVLLSTQFCSELIRQTILEDWKSTGREDRDS